MTEQDVKEHNGQVFMRMRIRKARIQVLLMSILGTLIGLLTLAVAFWGLSWAWKHRELPATEQRLYSGEAETRSEQYYIDKGYDTTQATCLTNGDLRSRECLFAIMDGLRELSHRPH